MISLMPMAAKFIGTKEIPGTKDHPFIVWAISLCDGGASQHDELPWCSAYVNAIAWLCDLPRSKSLAARSWLKVGAPIAINDAKPGDVVILMRGAGPQPGPTILQAPGHVGFLDHSDGNFVWLLSGNTGNAINVSAFPISRVLGIRRLT